MIACLPLACCEARTLAAPPGLVFTKADVPALKARVAAPPCDQVWQRLLAQANAYCDPASAEFAAPEKVDAMPVGEGLLVFVSNLADQDVQATLSLQLARLKLSRQARATDALAGEAVPQDDGNLKLSIASWRHRVLRVWPR